MDGFQHDQQGRKPLHGVLQVRLGRRVWSKPPVGCYKLNVDAAYGKKCGVVDIVIRDDGGRVWLAAEVQIVSVGSPEQAEALAVIEGLELAISSQMVPFCLESDCQVLISKIGKIGTDLFHKGSMIDKIKN